MHGRQRPGCVRRESGNPRTGFKGIGRYSKPHDMRGQTSSRKRRFPLNCSVRKSPQYAAFKFRGPCQRSAIVRMGTASERYTTNFPNRRRNNDSRDAPRFSVVEPVRDFLMCTSLSSRTRFMERPLKYCRTCSVSRPPSSE